MNQIKKTPISKLGQGFMDDQYIPKGKDEFYLRNKQHPNIKDYRPLSSIEVKQLESNGNTSDNWKNVLVKGKFNTSLVQRCSFSGLIRIGSLEPLFLTFHDVRLPVGIYNSTIINCDFGDNVVINNVNYLSHYILGNEVIIVNVNEVAVSDHSKFGNGIIKKGEKESVRIWMELCNENAGRRVLLFDGMQTGDAWLWTRYRGDEPLMKKFIEFTEKRFDNRRGYYGMIGDRSVIKNTRIIKDVLMGTDVYIKGANKLKNLTINSSAESPTQIGEGCEMVNGIIGFGCKAFYGVKAVRFILASHSQLKYGARLINSFLGDNSTISCCEVLNSLIFPAHEQHHNNSFLCASVLMGQSNMAAGATIGSNHNSRGADGELIAGRGFWPGLCVSLKHNSRFASFTLIAKGDFPAELNVPIPFSLVSNDVTNDRLVIMPAYWFLYNMYALARNAGKYNGRDKRTFRNQYFEYDYLAPDSINEILSALTVIEQAVGESVANTSTRKQAKEDAVSKGKGILQSGKDLSKQEILVSGFENSSRKVQLIKVAEAYALFKELVVYHGMMELIHYMEREKNYSIGKAIVVASKRKRSAWINIGGQLMPKPDVDRLIREIHSGKVKSWEEVHEYYHARSAEYPIRKLQHAVASMLEVLGKNAASFRQKDFEQLLLLTVKTKEWMTKGIYDSRAKDYSSPFRQMVYETKKEMENVVGKLKDNGFIEQQEQELQDFRILAKRLSTTVSK